jgi:hypothetical protein
MPKRHHCCIPSKCVPLHDGAHRQDMNSGSLIVSNAGYFVYVIILGTGYCNILIDVDRSNEISLLAATIFCNLLQQASLRHPLTRV